VADHTLQFRSNGFDFMLILVRTSVPQSLDISSCIFLPVRFSD
jgi:hypothetical protein